MSADVRFQCGWIEQAVRKCLGKAEGPLSAGDMEAVRYVRIGESFDNGFLVLHPARNYTSSTAYFTVCRVVVSQRRDHSASFLRLAG